MRRSLWFAAWVAPWGLGLTVAACDDGAEGSPDGAADAVFHDSDQAADVMLGDASDPCVDEAAVRPILDAHCTSCHGGSRPSARLDLETPGVLARLAAQTSVHAACRNTTLVVPGAPGEGLFMAKLLGTLTDCGDPMPPQGRLEPSELQCFARWISAANDP